MNRIIEKIAAAVIGTEFEGNTYVVGGYVRDLVMEKISSDIDIVVSLKKGGIKLAGFLHDQGIASRPVLFSNFETASTMIDDCKVEFVMTRRESYRNYDRKPDVFPGSLKEDVFRRDFTINSLLMDICRKDIIDLTGSGRKDIEKKLIRSTTDPEVIFAEDPLRMLRAIRFAVNLGFEIEEETAKGILKNAGMLEFISWERKRDEIDRILLSLSPAKGIRMIFSYNLIRNLIPEMMNLYGLAQNKYHDQDVLEHTLCVLNKTPEILSVRLAALLHDIGKAGSCKVIRQKTHFYGHEKLGSEITGKVLRRLKYSRSFILLVRKLVQNHMRFKQSGKDGEIVSDKILRKTLTEIGDDLDNLLLLVEADNFCHAVDYRLPDQVPGLRKRFAIIKKERSGKTLPLNGKDIIEHFQIRTGEAVGKLLTKAQEIWHEHPRWDKKKILEEIKFKEDTMENNESKVTKTTRDAVKKAYDVGEDVVKALSRITKEIVHTAKEEDLSNKEKVQKLAREALEGAKQGAKSAQPEAEEFLKKAGKTIIDAIKIAAPKIAHFTHGALKGVYEGAKDVYDEKHLEDKKTEEKEKK